MFVQPLATAVHVALRRRIVSLADDGMGNKEIARRLAVAPRTAVPQRSRFIEYVRWLLNGGVAARKEKQERRRVSCPCR